MKDIKKLSLSYKYKRNNIYIITWKVKALSLSGNYVIPYLNNLWGCAENLLAEIEHAENVYVENEVTDTENDY